MKTKTLFTKLLQIDAYALKFTSFLKESKLFIVTRQLRQVATNGHWRKRMPIKNFKNSLSYYYLFYLSIDY